MANCCKSGDSEIKTVCGGAVDHPDQYPSAIYQGNTLNFCTQGCLRAFEANPEGFLAGEVDHPIEID